MKKLAKMKDYACVIGMVLALLQLGILLVNSWFVERARDDDGLIDGDAIPDIIWLLGDLGDFIVPLLMFCIPVIFYINKQYNKAPAAKTSFVLGGIFILVLVLFVLGFWPGMFELIFYGYGDFGYLVYDAFYNLRISLIKACGWVSPLLIVAIAFWAESHIENKIVLWSSIFLMATLFYAFILRLIGSFVEDIDIPLLMQYLRAIAMPLAYAFFFYAAKRVKQTNNNL